MTSMTSMTSISLSYLTSSYCCSWLVVITEVRVAETGEDGARPEKYSTVQYSTVQYSTVQY